jgi:SMI1-KNR4 cell-wall
MFQMGAKFKPKQRTFLEDSEGFHSLEILYGAADDDYGLRENNSTYRDQIGLTLVVIGESPGGNQICFEKKTGRILFWHHEAPIDEESIFEIATDFSEFVRKLEPENASAERRTQKIVESKSFGFLDGETRLRITCF